MRVFVTRVHPVLQLPTSVKFEVSPPGCVVIQNTFRFSSTLEVSRHDLLPSPGSVETSSFPTVLSFAANEFS